MDNAAEFLEEHIKEQGVSGVTVSEVTKINETVFIIRKRVGDELIGMKYAPTPPRQPDTLQKELAIQSKQIAKAIEDEAYQHLDLYGFSRVVQFDFIDSYKATCLLCESTATLPSRPYSINDMRLEEDTEPMAMGTHGVYDNGHPDIDPSCEPIAKMYLLGQLSRKCDDHCPLVSERFKYV